MRRALYEILVLLLSVGLTVSVPVLSHARMASSNGAAAHDHQVVQHYADLAIDPGDEDCRHATPEGLHHQDDVCKKCCSACLSVSLIPTLPAAAVIPSGVRDILFMLDEALVARTVPTEPGIPKSL
jgi:hypothetical protein